MLWPWVSRGEIYLSSRNITFLFGGKIIGTSDYWGNDEIEKTLAVLFSQASRFNIKTYGVWLGGGVSELGVLSDIPANSSIDDMKILVENDFASQAAAGDRSMGISNPSKAGVRTWFSTSSALLQELMETAAKNKVKIVEIAPITNAVCVQSVSDKNNSTAVSLIIESDAISVVSENVVGLVRIQSYSNDLELPNILERVSIQAITDTYLKRCIVARSSFDRQALELDSWNMKALKWDSRLLALDCAN